MRVTDTGRNSPVRQTTENYKGAEAIATIWLVFYVFGSWSCDYIALSSQWS